MPLKAQLQSARGPGVQLLAQRAVSPALQVVLEAFEQACGPVLNVDIVLAVAHGVSADAHEQQAGHHAVRHGLPDRPRTFVEHACLEADPRRA